MKALVFDPLTRETSGDLPPRTAQVYFEYFENGKWVRPAPPGTIQAPRPTAEAIEILDRCIASGGPYRHAQYRLIPAKTQTLWHRFVALF